jgi:hypothetical protein
MGKMPDGKLMYTLDGRPVTEEPEGSPEEKHYKRIINQVSGYVREVCTQLTQTVPKAIVHCMVLQVRVWGGHRVGLCLAGCVGCSVTNVDVGPPVLFPGPLCAVQPAPVNPALLAASRLCAHTSTCTPFAHLFPLQPTVQG